MPRLLSVLCAAGLLLIVQAPLSADPIPIYELASEALPDVRDGTVADWLELVPGPSLTTADFRDAAWRAGEPIESGDEVRVYLGWNAALARIYVAVERSDDFSIDNYMGSGTGDDMTLHDSIQLMVDGDHSGGGYVIRGGTVPDKKTDPEAYEAYVEEVLLAEDLQAQKYQAIAVALDQRHLCLSGPADLRKPWATQPPYGDGLGTQDPSAPQRTLVELYVTAWDSLNYHGAEYSRTSRLRPGGMIGLQVAVIDYDQDSRDWDGFYTVNGGRPSDYEADSWLEAVLLPRDGGSTGSGIAAGGWGWIKDLRRRGP